MRLLLLVFLILTNFAIANTFGYDDRQAERRSKHTQLGAIGMLYNKQYKTAGTAFLVSKCYILTNHHVGLPEGNKVSSKFFVGNFTKTKRGDSSTATPVMWGKFTKQDPSQDWALLKLNKCLGKKYQYIKLKKLSYKKARKKGTRLRMAGQPGTKRISRIWTDPNCAIKGKTKYSKEIWYHSCSSNKGSSGSPIYYIDGYNQYRAIALNMGHFIVDKKHQRYDNTVGKYSNRYANLAVPVKVFFNKITSIPEIKTAQTEKNRDYYLRRAQ